MKKVIAVIFVFISLSSNLTAQFSISASGAFAIPNGSFSDYYNTAFGLRGNIFYSTSDNASFFLHTGYNVWKFNNDKFNDLFHSSGEVGTFNLEIPITAIPLLVGTRYSFDYSRISKIYLEAAAGVYLISTDASGKFTDNTGTHDLGNEKKNYTEFSIHFGCGTMMALSSNLSLDAGIYLDYITDSEAAKQAKTKNSKDYYEGNQVKTLILCIGLKYQL